MAFTSRITLLAALAVAAFQAQAVNVTVAYQTSAEPAKVAQADNTFAKTSGATVDWRKFDSGASVVRALASGDVQIGNIGSSPLAVAASQQVPIEVFLLASKLGNSEALVVKKSITKPEDLIGKLTVVVANLEPRKMMGSFSQGMLLSASDGADTPSGLYLLEPFPGAKPGMRLH